MDVGMLSEALRIGTDSLLVGAGAFGGFVFLRQRRFVFRPSPHMLPLPYELAGLTRVVSIPSTAGTLRGWWATAAGSARERVDGAILFFPGAFGNLSHDVESIAFLARTGASVLAVDYPGYGQSDGKPSERALYAAAEATWSYLTDDLAVDPRRVVFVGRSLGSILAMRMAANVGAKGLVVHSAFPSIPHVAAKRYPFFPVRPFCFIRFDARVHAGRVRCPTLFVHGRDDRWVPCELARRCYRAIRAPKRFALVPEGHRGAAWTKVPAVREALDQLWSGESEAWS
jgi:pimeloyl-ACP methyl ester carboxylesterase